jgi:hypothetical protein
MFFVVIVVYALPMLGSKKYTLRIDDCNITVVVAKRNWGSKGKTSSKLHFFGGVHLKYICHVIVVN